MAREDVSLGGLFISLIDAIDSSDSDIKENEDELNNLIKHINEEKSLREAIKKFCDENKIELPEHFDNLLEPVPTFFLSKIIYYIKKFFKKLQMLLKKMWS